MTPKEFLTQGYRISERIDSLRNQLEALMKGMSSPNYSNIGGYGNERKSPTEKRGLKAIELEEKIKTEIAKLEAVQLAIFNAIEGLDSINERLVLRYRYIELTHDGKQPSWEIIAYRMHYSVMQVARLHGKALEHLKF